MNNNTLYWIWLQKALGEGARIKEIVEDFGSAKALYESNILEWRMSPSLVPKQINRLQSVTLEDAQKIKDDCDKNGWQIITYEDEKYPNRLKEIINPPAVLYVDGEFPNVDNEVLIAMVGTRKASDYAIKVTDIMSRGVSECGAVVVSGGALGVDASAHRGAILSGGRTIAVLGCGLGTNYLLENKSLRESIKHNGALVTEYPPFTKPSKYTFPMRNRIISGLSLGVLVVEAGVKSGSLITAEFALQQNRDVFAVPCSILSSEFSGTNKLIDDGAYVVTKPLDLLSPYAEMYNLDLSKVKSVQKLMSETADKSANVTVNKNKISFENLDNSRRQRVKNQKQISQLFGNNRLVYESLTDEFTHIDIIKQNCGLSSSAVLSALTALEIADLVESASGKRYKLS